MPNKEVDMKVTEDGATSLYHKSSRTSSHGSNGANAG